MLRQWSVPAFCLAILVCLGCGRGGETNAAQIAAGQVLYTQRCAYCHEVEGAIGPRITSRIIRYYGTAHRLYNYVHLAMPYDAPGSLAEQEYWDIVAYLLNTEGLIPPDVRLRAETADEVSWER